MSAPATECGRCGAALPPDARFCPACGLPVAEDPTSVEPVPRHETSEAPVTIGVAMPRYFGLTPPILLFTLAAAVLASAIVLAILAHWLVAILLALVSLLLLALFVGASQRKPDSAVARSSARAFVRARERTGWLLESFALRSAAGREAARLRHAHLAAQSRRESLLRALGEAVYRGDSEATEKLTEDVGAVDGETDGLETAMRAIEEETRERLEQGRLRVQPTLIEPPQPPNVPEPSPPPDEGTPPTPPIVPEPYPPPDEGTPPTPAPVPEPGPEQDI